MEDIRVEPLADSSDDRGISFSVVQEQLSAIGPVQDLHIAAIKPGHVRGNHYHSRRGELIAVIYRDAWSLHWDTGPGTDRRENRYTGTGAVAVIPPLNWSHAVRNDGREDLWIVSASDAPYDRHDSDPESRDAIPRLVAR
ncbi:polysaccharide biosynthesis C-terminal domain-containing protein [Geodermatophilus sp. URMC 64]